MKILLHLFILFLIVTLFEACSTKEPIDYFGSLISCSSENKVDNHFEKDSILFLNGTTQSADFACTGQYSSKLDKDHKYGLGYVFPEVKPGDQIQVEIRRKKGSQSALVLQIDSGEFFSENKIKGFDGEWEYIRISVILKGNYTSSRAKTFCVISKQDSVAYFDDLKIYHLPRNHEFKRPILENSFQINIDSTQMDQLKSNRIQAFHKGIILPRQKAWYKTRFLFEGDTINGKFRFKGDWVEHLLGDKWSYRIKLKKEVLGMKNFSIQKPESRQMLMEWTYHKVLEQEGLLATKYDFIPVNYNEKAKGVFAIEEHFKKEFCTSRNLLESAIICWDDKKMWELRTSALKGETYRLENQIPMLLSFPLKSYIKENKEKAIQLLDEFRHGARDVSSTFDLNKTSKFWALSNILKADHTLIWHNNKYYFNPNTQLLEPIGFDGYGHDEMNFIRPFIGDKSNDLYDPLFYLFLSDSLFMEAYSEQLHHYNDSSFFETALKNIDSELMERETLLQKEFPDYHYSSNYIFRNLSYLNERLATFNPYEYLKTNNDNTLFHESFLSQQYQCDTLIESVHLKIDSTGIRSYYPHLLEYEINGSLIELPKYEYLGRPKLIPLP